MLSLSLAVVVPHGLDVVAVRIVDEGGIVARPVIPVPGAAVVFSACGKTSLVECLDLRTALRFECHVQGRYCFLCAYPEISVLAIVESSSLAVFHVVPITERLEH